MGHSDDRWRVQHDIRVEKVKDEFPMGLVIFFVICLLLGLMFGN